MSAPFFPVTAGLFLLLASTRHLEAETWPQWRGEKRDGIWRETGLIESFPDGGLKRAWSVPVGPGYCGPTVTEDRIYLMDRGLDPEVEEERILCLDRHSGETLWKLAYPCVYEDVAYDVGPRASVTVHDGLAFALGTMGDLHALDAITGEVIWKRGKKSRRMIREITERRPVSPLTRRHRGSAPFRYEVLCLCHRRKSAKIVGGQLFSLSRDTVTRLTGSLRLPIFAT